MLRDWQPCSAFYTTDAWGLIENTAIRACRVLFNRGLFVSNAFWYFITNCMRAWQMSSTLYIRYDLRVEPSIRLKIYRHSMPELLFPKVFLVYHQTFPTLKLERLQEKLSETFLPPTIGFTGFCPVPHRQHKVSKTFVWCIYPPVCKLKFPTSFFARRPTFQ